MAYAATFDIDRPAQAFDKAQILLRILIIVVVGWLASWVFNAAYWVLPILAAVMISQKGAEQYLADAEQGPVRWIRYLMGAYSYIALATDKLPFDNPDAVNVQVRPGGTPSVGSALLRIILAIPHAIVLGIIGIAFVVVWIISAISILVNATYPEWAFNFIRGYLRWNTRLLAYMASLVDEYPPFSFSDDGAPAASPPASPPAEPPASPPAEPPASPPAEPPASPPAEPPAQQ